MEINTEYGCSFVDAFYLQSMSHSDIISPWTVPSISGGATIDKCLFVAVLINCKHDWSPLHERDQLYDLFYFLSYFCGIVSAEACVIMAALLNWIGDQYFKFPFISLSLTGILLMYVIKLSYIYTHTDDADMFA